MAQLDVNRTRELLQAFEFQRLFLEQLGWEKPSDSTPLTLSAAGREYRGHPIATLGGVAVLEVTSEDGEVPDAKARLGVWREVIQTFHENLLIFVDHRRSQSIWEWFKRDGSKVYPRPHHYFQGQPGDLFLSKLSSLVVDLADLDQKGKVPVTDVALRLKRALDVERVTKRFYNEFRAEHERFLDLLAGIEDERDRRWYASVLLNRLMFVYFLQRKGFLDRRDYEYLQNKLAASQERGKDRFYDFLKLLFFEGFAKPAEERSPETHRLLGEIRYLDGGLFLPHKVEMGNPAIHIPDAAFEGILKLFSSYTWNLNDTPGGDDQEINPDVLGYIFEKYINQKAFGAYYTRPEITRYLCERTIYPLILSKVNTGEIPGVAPRQAFEAIEDLFLKLDARLCRKLLDEILPSISILDPACGSGAFLVAALKVLIDVYSAVVGRAKFTADAFVQSWLRKTEKEHPSLNYGIKKRIITDNLFGVDIMEEGTEITKLRLFLALVASATHVEDLEPLPNIDFNILAGNSLIGLLHVQAEDFDSRQAQGNLFRRPYKEVVAEKNRQIENYRHATSYAERLQAIRDQIEAKKQEATATLNWMLLSEFTERGIKFEEATWDERAKKAGKTKRRPVAFKDIEALRPFHWGYEFDQVLEAGGFDIVLTNPPWEVFKPQAKEFFAEYSSIVTKNKMTIKEFEKEQGRLLKSREVREAWLEYQSRFPHVSLYFRTAPEYENQISTLDGNKVGTDINLYKLFLERCFRLLQPGGHCGILLPASIYSDLGSKRLRQMLLVMSRVKALIGLSNERFIFEGLDHRFKICLLVIEKGGSTSTFQAAFRTDPREAISKDRLESFLENSAEHITLSQDLVTRLSPNSLSVMEFKDERDISAVEKMLRFPRLKDRIEGAWQLVLCNELHMTQNSGLFKEKPSAGRLPLVEGKHFHQFEHRWGRPRFWITEMEARELLLDSRAKHLQKLLGSEAKHLVDTEQMVLDYEVCRLAFRDVARNTDERTLIATILPPRIFAPHTVSLESVFQDTVLSNRPHYNVTHLSSAEKLYLVAVLNSFVLDYLIRHKVTSHCSFFHVYDLPVPRLTEDDPGFAPLVTRAAQLICTTQDFADFWRDVMGTPWSSEVAVKDHFERERLRAELDGLVAHLYGVTEVEFAHILTTFPVVPQPVKDAALEAYRQFAPKPGDPEIGRLISQGEGHELEFKSTIRWDLKESKENPELRRVVQRTVAGFLNAEGGTLLLGVADDGSVVGLEPDFMSLKRKNNRDGYELFLMGTLLDTLGKDVSHCLRISFHPYDGKEVCRVTVTKSPRPVYLDEAFYVRTGNSTQRLSIQQAVEYVKAHWG